MDKIGLIQKVIGLQRNINILMEQQTVRLWIDWGLTIPQLKCLFIITEKGSVNFRKLAEALEVTPSNVTGIVDHLVVEGLVSRVSKPEDRRVILLRITPKGQALLNNIREDVNDYMTAALTLLSEDELAYLERGLIAYTKAAASIKRMESTTTKAG
jgi:DNA-binding MarR family transcriptional regulator